MPSSIFDLRATHNPNRWYLPLEDRLCVGPQGRNFMFGGVGLAASIQALERTYERPLIWATAQYLSYARPPSVVDFDVRAPNAGKYTTQARVIAHVGDKEILTVNAALGARPRTDSIAWVKAPAVAPPEDCPAVEHWRGDDGGLHGQIELRVAKGFYGFESGAPRPPSEDGRLILWMRAKDGHAIDASTLAIFADHVPSGIGNALGYAAGGNSLDNTIRIVNLAPTDWVLCDIGIHGIHAGFGHGAMRIFARDGALMATASQSVIVRDHRDREE